MSDALEQSTTEAAEVGVLRVVDLDDTPRVDPGTDELTINLNLFLRADNGEGHHSLEEIFSI